MNADKKLTDSEIVKALKELLKELKGKKQLIVPEEGVKNLCYCLQNHLDLINRLQANNKRLTNLCREQNTKIDWLIKSRNNLLYNLKAVCEEKDEENVKAEAYKEFAERLLKK